MVASATRLKASPPSNTVTYYKRCSAFQRETGLTDACPLRGCWADALAAGYAEELVKRAVALYSTALLSDLIGLNSGEQAQLLRAWEKGSAYCVYILLLKFGCWRTLPWILCGIAHSDAEVGRRVTKDARTEWQRTVGVRDLHASLTKSLFEVESLSSELDAFIDGRPLCELQSLWSFGCRLRLVRLNEVSVERLHRMASLAVAHAPHAEGAYLSLHTGRQTELLGHVLWTTGPSQCISRGIRRHVFILEKAGSDATRTRV